MKRKMSPQKEPVMIGANLVYSNAAAANKPTGIKKKG
jgi:hypothetical protein